MSDEEKKTVRQVNALAALAPYSEMGLIGPTVDDDISRAISRYGAKAVKAAVAKATKQKRGPKSKMVWRNIRHLIEEDAVRWLEGGDPFSERSNYSIAKYYADNFEGHSHPATMKMVERHLKKNREWMTLAVAEDFSQDNYPHALHIKAKRELGAALDAALGKKDISLHKYAEQGVARYEKRFGRPPEPELSMAEIEAKLSTPQLPNISPRRGLFGSFRKGDGS